MKGESVLRGFERRTTLSLDKGFFEGEELSFWMMDLRQLETVVGEESSLFEDMELLFHSPEERSRLSFERGRLLLFFRFRKEGPDRLFLFKDEKNTESAVLLILWSFS